MPEKPAITRAYLLAKADGVSDVVKWMKKSKKEGNHNEFGKVEFSNAAIIGVEKYVKKLRHDADEAEF